MSGKASQIPRSVKRQINSLAYSQVRDLYPNHLPSYKRARAMLYAQLAIMMAQGIPMDQAIESMVGPYPKMLAELAQRMKDIKAME